MQSDPIVGNHSLSTIAVKHIDLGTRCCSVHFE